jgi:hypothetical protein
MIPEPLAWFSIGALFGLVLCGWPWHHRFSRYSRSSRYRAGEESNGNCVPLPPEPPPPKGWILGPYGYRPPGDPSLLGLVDRVLRRLPSGSHRQSACEVLEEVVAWLRRGDAGQGSCWPVAADVLDAVLKQELSTGPRKPQPHGGRIVGDDLCTPPQPPIKPEFPAPRRIREDFLQ